MAGRIKDFQTEFEQNEHNTQNSTEDKRERKKAK